MGIARAGRRFQLSPNRPDQATFGNYYRNLNAPVGYATISQTTGTTPVNIAIPQSTMLGDSGFIVSASYLTVSPAPVGWTTWATYTSGSLQLALFWKWYDETDIANGYVTFTPGAAGATTTFLTTLRGKGDFTATATTSTSTADTATASFAPATLFHEQFAIRAVHLASGSQTLDMITPPWVGGYIAHVHPSGTNSIGMTMGRQVTRSTSARTMDVDTSGTPTASLWVHTAVGIYTPPVVTPPPLRLKRAINRAAAARSRR